jgi:hypothetical protein
MKKTNALKAKRNLKIAGKIRITSKSRNLYAGILPVIGGPGGNDINHGWVTVIYNDGSIPRDFDFLKFEGSAFMGLGEGEQVELAFWFDMLSTRGTAYIWFTFGLGDDQKDFLFKTIKF